MRVRENAAPLRASPFRLDLGTLRGDLFAGATVALVGLPQCLAYAIMSGLPPAYGLVTAAVPGLMAALIGRSPQVVTGPTNTTGLLILTALGPWLGASGLLESEAGLAAMATLALLAGAIRIAGSVAGAAKLLRFIPDSVLVGFTVGAGILIAANQLDEALGLPPIRGGGLYDVVAGIAQLIADGHMPMPGAVAVTLGTMAAVLAGTRWRSSWPVALVVVSVSALLAWIFGLDSAHGLPLIAERSPIPLGWPSVAAPSLAPSLVADLALPAAAIALLGTLELSVSARAGGARPDMRREIAAQGVANVAGAFTGAFPASASLSRSALLKVGGARTRLSAIVAALAVVPIILFAGPAVGYITQASLAAVLLVTAMGMIRWKQIARMWTTSRETRALLLVTLIGTLVLPFEEAILAGAGLAIILHLAHTSVPRITALTPEGDRLRPIAPAEKPSTVVLEVSGNLHYAAVPPFVEAAREQIPEGAELVVIDLSHAHDLRFAAVVALEEMAAKLAQDGIALRLAGVDPAFRATLARSHSPLCATPADPEPGASVRRCLAG